jgi:hypothetical protein
LRDTNVTECFDGKRLIKLLLSLRVTQDSHIRDRILALDAEISELDRTIAERESGLHALVYGLYGLSPEEIAMVEAG